MRVIDPGWASRFYGMDVSPRIVAAVRERLTESDRDDLVDAHLAINYAYFGALDKTLSGFVVLDDEGDNYTLLDVRDGGQVFWQDHETRELVLKHDRLEDWPDGASVATARTSRLVSSAALLARYQWLVWLLAQPLTQQGTPVQTADQLVRNAIGRFRHVWPRREAHDEAFEAELPLLAADPHLAIYWLLHTTLLADEPRGVRVLAAIGDGGPALLRAFVARFGGLPLAGELHAVPEFRCRRALAALYGAFEPTAEEVSRAALRALEIEPGTNTLRNALQILDGIEKGHVDAAAVADAMARITVSTSGVELVLAALAKRDGATSSAHADTLARRLEPGTQMWWFALEALWRVHELAFDGEALLQATRAILAHDRYHPRALQMAIRAAGLANEPTAGLEADLELANAILPALQQVYASADALKPAVISLAEPARRALATRILQRAVVNRPDPAVAAWAAGLVVADSAGAALVGEALAALDPATQADVIARAKAAIDGPAHPLVDVLLAFVDGVEPADHDFAAGYTVKRGKEAAIGALAPHAIALFDRLVRLLERPAGASVVQPILGKLTNPFEKATYIVPQLDAAQAVRLARAMIAIRLRHPQIQTRNAAGHQLFRFHHPGAESFLIDALDDYATRFADGEDGDLEDVVANLYNAVRGLATPRARTALLGRLATERRAFWRLGSAIKDAFDDALHAEALAFLRAKRDPRAAGVYGYALVEHVKITAPLLELAGEIVAWPAGDDAVANGYFHYALVVAEAAALAASDFELVRRLHAAARAITEAPIQPDAHARGRDWKHPLAEPDVLARLSTVLSREADVARQALAAAGEAARAQGTPNVAITDAELAVLAGATVRTRLLHDEATGEVWFRDADARLHYFDGFAVVEPPFTAHAVALAGMREHLAGAVQLDERFLAWDAKRAHFREVLRLGARLVLHWGTNNGTTERHVVTFATEDAAAAALRQLRAAPDYHVDDPFYLDGIGAVVRNYYVPLADGGYNDKREALTVPLDVLDLDAAIQAHQDTELRWLRDENATLLSLEYSTKHRRAQDLTVAEWIARRFRRDANSPVWHLRALADLAIYLEAHALVIPTLDLQLGAPASDADIDAFAAHCTHPVPEALRAMWRTHGRASWRLGDHAGLRLLGPREVLARRPAARALGERWLARLTPEAAIEASAAFDHLDVLVETLDGTPVSVVADLARDDGRVFLHAVDDPDEVWWEASLSWILATRLLDDLAHVLAVHAPILARLYYGQRRNPDELAAYLENGSSGTYVDIVVDPVAGVLSTRTGKHGAPGATMVERIARARAHAAFDAKLADKRRAGYRDAPRPQEMPVRASGPSPTEPIYIPAVAAELDALRVEEPAEKKPAGKKPAGKKRPAKSKQPTAKKSAAKRAPRSRR